MQSTRHRRAIFEERSERSVEIEALAAATFANPTANCQVF
jgi:hypothetical protein